MTAVIAAPSFLSFIACMTSLPPPSPMKLPSKLISSKIGLLSIHLDVGKVYCVMSKHHYVCGIVLRARPQSGRESGL